VAKRKITMAMQKAAFRTLAAWIATDDDRLRAFIKALKPKKRRRFSSPPAQEKL
jgi:hypothetical protein